MLGAMKVDILIPSMDNRRYLAPCVQSMLQWTTAAEYRILVVNNGQPGSCEWVLSPKVDVLEAGGNRGWTGGLALGLAHTDAPAVLFLNDDTLMLPSSPDWLAKLVSLLDQPGVGAVGPATNCAIGAQSIFAETDHTLLRVPFLVGFCLLVKRDVLAAVGGVDASLPGGDDIDLSIRLRLYPALLLVDRTVFVYHHGFVTGTRVHGPAHIAGGWNSRMYSETVHAALLAKHGHEGLRLVGWEG